MTKNNIEYWERLRNRIHEGSEIKIRPRRMSKKPIKIFIGNENKNVYLNKREAQCAYLMLMGDSRQVVSEKLNISPRTYDHYIKMIKIKLGCHHRDKAINILRELDFMKKFEEINLKKEFEVDPS